MSTPWLRRFALDRPEARAWVLYDWANSAFWTTVVTAVFPVYFIDLARELGRERATERFTQATTLALIVSALVAPVLAGPIAARRLPAGALVEVFPLRLPAGEGAGITLGAWGELAFANVAGQLVLTVPRVSARWIGAALGGALVDARERPGGRAELTVAVRPGLRTAWPLGTLGEIALETPLA